MCIDNGHKIYAETTLNVLPTKQLVIKEVSFAVISRALRTVYSYINNSEWEFLRCTVQLQKESAYVFIKVMQKQGGKTIRYLSICQNIVLTK